MRPLERTASMVSSRGMGLAYPPRMRSAHTNALEAALTAYAGRGRRLNDEELNGLIDDLGLRPAVQVLNS